MSKLVKAVSGLLVLALAFVGFAFVKGQGWLSVVGIESTSSDSQVITAIERTEEVALLRLGIQGIKTDENKRSIAGWGVPGTQETRLIQYEFDAKLGIDGSKVKVTKDGEDSFRVVIPEFVFIGYDEPVFKDVVEDGGVLQWVTPEVDPLDMVNEILDDKAQDDYIEKNEAMLQEQARFFYDTLIRSVQPEAKTTFEFSA